MKVFVIPDIHLKPWIFDEADRVLSEHPEIDAVVSLGDIPDDFGKKNDSELYNQTYDRAEQFLSDHPDSLWCIGNHDISYLWDKWQSGMAYRAKETAYHRIKAFYEKIPKGCLEYVFRIDDVIFSHAGISASFAEDFCFDVMDHPDQLIRKINNDLRSDALWFDSSPLWFRPQRGYRYGVEFPVYRKDQFLYVVGHTPMEQVTLRDSVLSCDVFSTYRNGKPVGSRHFVVVDTETKEYTEYEAEM